MNWKGFKDDLGGAIVSSLEGLVEGAAEDLLVYGEKISNQLTVAIRSNMPELRDELLEQLGLLAEIHRIRVSSAGARMLEAIIGVVFAFGRAAVAR